MLVRVGIQAIKRALKEYDGGDVTTCCPLHQVVRPHIKRKFTVGRSTIEFAKSEKTYRFLPGLPDELYTTSGWELALDKVRRGHVYKFDILNLKRRVA